MPRPGPRPYECVRRAWHSDRHQPIRGSLIQEIFRIASEVHRSGTRKNREWQEKLPVVVLKAEEIMYSKANSEAEYVDLNTLWDRVNDAIDTIIRRDKSTESAGEFLQPCIEAALHLGCTPRRSSRSQRNESRRCYLRQQISPNPNPNPNPNVPHNPNNSNIITANNTTISTCLMLQNSPYLTPYGLIKAENHSGNGCVQAHYASPTMWSVYPLYHDNQIPPNTLPVKRPLPYCPAMECNNKSGPPTNVSPTLELDASNFCFQSNNGHAASDKGNAVECDLTLRLGSLVVPCSASVENRSPIQVGEHFCSREEIQELYQ